MTQVIMPKMGDGMEEGTLVEWLVNDGDKVKSGQVIGHIQTDKATLELEAPGSGAITGFLITPGQTVPVGVPIAALLKDGEALPNNWSSAPSSAASTPEAPAAAPAAQAEAVSTPVATSVTSGRVKASPLAKKLAQAKGIDLAQVSGSGPNGRIVAKDLDGASTAVATKPTTTTSVTPVAATAEDKKVPLNRLRTIIAERTQHSKQTVPHFYVTVEVDLEKILALREQFAAEESGKISINDFVVKASVKALQDMPEVNATFQGDHVLQYGAVHIGIAAAIDDGLLVPVIKNAHGLTIRQLSAKAKELVTKARDGKLLPDEMSGSTFSISNMGMLNVDLFGAIINEPNCAIVAVSSAKKMVVVNDEDEVEVRSRMNLTGSFDHRVLDGAVGAKFMNVLRDYLENPTRLFD